MSSSNQENEPGGKVLIEESLKDLRIEMEHGPIVYHVVPPDAGILKILEIGGAIHYIMEDGSDIVI